MSKQKKPQWRKENGRLVATLPNSAQDQVLANRRASREAAKEAGTLGRSSGSGAHGGGKRTRNRRDRRNANNNIRAGRFDGYCDD